MNIASIPAKYATIMIVGNEISKTKTEMSIEQLIAKRTLLKNEIVELKKSDVENKDCETYVLLYLEKKLNLRKIEYKLFKNGVIKKPSFEENLTAGVIESTRQERLEKIKTLILKLSEIKTKIFNLKKTFEINQLPLVKMNLLKIQLIEWQLYDETLKYSAEEIRQSINNLNKSEKRKSIEEVETPEETRPSKRKKVTESEVDSESQQATMLSNFETDFIFTSGTDSESSEDISQKTIQILQAQIERQKKEIDRQKKEIDRQNGIISQNQFTIKNLTRNLNDEIAYKTQSSATIQ